MILMMMIMFCCIVDDETCFCSRPTPVSVLMAQYAFQEKLLYSELMT